LAAASLFDDVVLSADEASPTLDVMVLTLGRWRGDERGADAGAAAVVEGVAAVAAAEAVDDSSATKGVMDGGSAAAAPAPVALALVDVVAAATACDMGDTTLDRKKPSGVVGLGLLVGDGAVGPDNGSDGVVATADTLGLDGTVDALFKGRLGLVGGIPGVPAFDVGTLPLLPVLLPAL
jgi:hypothetical protein